MSGFVAKWLKFSLVALVGCGFMGMIIYSLMKRDEIRSAQIEPTLIAAPIEPAKRRPDEPGGMEIPNQDKMVFDLLDSSSTPRMTDEAQMAKVAETIAPAAGDVPEVMVTPSEAMEAPALVIEEQKPAPVVKPVEQVAMIEPAKVVEKPVAKAVETVAAKEEIKTVMASGWGVQLASVGSRADAEKEGAKLAKKLSALKGMQPRVQAASGRYRIQFASVASRTQAAAVCKRLSAQGQACFPVKIQ